MNGGWNGVKMADLTAPTPEQARELFGMVTMAEALEGAQRLCEAIRNLGGYWWRIGPDAPRS